MREIRITIRGEDFAAVSEKLVGIGVTFQVEPLEGEEQSGTARATASPRAATPKKKTAKKLAATERSSAVSGGAAEAAARLRAMAERNRAAGARPDEPEETTTPPFDSES
jgi:hypothetical protein